MSKNAINSSAATSRLCPECRGRGCVPGKTPGDWARCPKCRGEGRAEPRRKPEAAKPITEPKSKE